MDLSIKGKNRSESGDDKQAGKSKLTFEKGEGGPGDVQGKENTEMILSIKGKNRSESGHKKQEGESKLTFEKGEGGPGDVQGKEDTEMDSSTEERKIFGVSKLSQLRPRIQQVLMEKATFIWNLVEGVISPGAMDRRRNEQWKLWVQGGADHFMSLITSKDRILRDHIRYGIPCSLRSYVWSLLLGSDRLKQDHLGLFQYLCDQEVERNIDCKEVIDTDYYRCKFFNSKLTGEPLRKILVAYTLYNENLKYTQGMGYLAGLLLVQLNAPEQAFWAYVAVMEGYSAGRTQMAAFFEKLSSPDKALTVRCTRYLNDLVKESIPDFWARLAEEGLDCKGFTMTWFSTIFSLFPLHFTLRIWDIILFEGYEIVFFVAVALLKCHKKELLQMEGVQLTNALPRLHILFPSDADKILQMAWSIQANHTMPSDIKQMVVRY